MRVESYIYIGCLLTLACAFFVILKVIRRSEKRFVLLDVILVWPLLLKGQPSRGEKYFVIAGVLIALLLIVAAQFINN